MKIFIKNPPKNDKLNTQAPDIQIYEKMVHFFLTYWC